MKLKMKSAAATMVLLATMNLSAQSMTKVASTTTLADLKTNLVELRAQVDLTVTALTSLKGSTRNSADLKNDLDNFSRAYATLENEIESVRSKAITMKARAKEHQDAWEKEVQGIQNPKFREKATDRLADEKKQFAKIIERGDEARQVLTPFLADLKDIKTFLDVDPSSKAVSSLSNPIWKLGNDTRTVRKRLDSLIEQIDKTVGTK